MELKEYTAPRAFVINIDPMELLAATGPGLNATDNDNVYPEESDAKGMDNFDVWDTWEE